MTSPTCYPFSFGLALLPAGFLTDWKIAAFSHCQHSPTEIELYRAFHFILNDCYYYWFPSSD